MYSTRRGRVSTLGVFKTHVYGHYPVKLKPVQSPSQGGGYLVSSQDALADTRQLGSSFNTTNAYRQTDRMA